MRKLLLILLFPICMKAQDTIVKKDGGVIPCKITEVKTEYLRYNPEKGPDGMIGMAYVASYKRNGVKTISGFKAPVRDSINLTDEIAYMQKCFINRRSQQRVGFVISALGYGFAFSSYLTIEPNTYNLYKSQKNFIATGLAVGILGSIISANSTKFMRRAGLGLSGNGVRYRFK